MVELQVVRIIGVPGAHHGDSLRLRPPERVQGQEVGDSKVDDRGVEGFDLSFALRCESYAQRISKVIVRVDDRQGDGRNGEDIRFAPPRRPA